MKELTRGEKIRICSGGELEIISKLGEGGQGIVYKVKYNGKEYALKWYFSHRLKNKDEFYKNIQDNIKLKAPTPAFLWPLEITEEYEGSFGYLMDLRPEEYKDFPQFLRAKEKFSSIEAAINAALIITDAFRELHLKGRSYQDLNDGNFFINPKNGEVLICDNDNVAEYGETLGIAGKSRYMAPEVVSGKKHPDTHTDKFSLAVILYMILFLNHPLEGAKTAICPCLTEELEKKFYGLEPVFVWDSQDNSNRPVRGIHVNEIRFWPIFPQFIREIFQKAFSKESMIGKDIEHRITEKEWKEAFIRLRDVLVICSCGSETFIDLKKDNSECISCKKSNNRLAILKGSKYSVVIRPNKKIYACHTENNDNFREVKGEIIKGKNDPTAIGLKNIFDNVWIATLPNGDSKSFSKGEVIKLGKGLKIDFGHNNVYEII